MRKGIKDFKSPETIEMTPKEALKKLRNWIYDKEYSIVEQALTELEALKRYPTAEEVCEALSDYLDDSVILFYKDFVATNTNRVVVNKYDDGEILMQVSLPPHLITLISRFYEGL